MAYVVIRYKRGRFDPEICQCTINQLNQRMNLSSHREIDHEALGG